jgi:hypothetical protein
MPEPTKPDPSISVPRPEPRQKSRFKTPGILIAVSAALILLGIGLCSAGGINFEHDSTHPFIVGTGTAAFWGGIFGFVVGVLWWLAALVGDF